VVGLVANLQADCQSAAPPQPTVVGEGFVE
jgi:hypothetical protein